MSNRTNDALWDMKRDEVEQYLADIGFDIGELLRDEKGYYVMRPDAACTDKDGLGCEPTEKCYCKHKHYLPANLQTI